MNNELTDWFPPDTVPFHFGEYERDHFPHAIIVTSIWDCEKWRYKSGATCLIQNLRWRGLKDNPEVIK